MRRVKINAVILARLPIFGCAGFVLFLFFAVLWNGAVERDWPMLRIRSAAPLAGLAKPSGAPWTVAQLLSGETQAAVSANVARGLPVFPIAVRARNQIILSVLKRSPTLEVVIGRDDELFEQVYIDEYCVRGATPAKEIEAWSHDIRAIQDGVTRSGKGFVYLLSPSKAALYPEKLPLNACPSVVAARPDKVGPFVEALRMRNVTYVDGVALMARNRRAFPFPLFPRGGSHWGAVGAALALGEIARAAPTRMGPFVFDWSGLPRASGDDTDLVGLLNLLRPDLNYPTAAIMRAGAPGDCAQAPRIVAIGTSFLNQIIIDAAQAPCPPQVEQWFHMRQPDGSYALFHYSHPPGDVTRGAARSSEAAALVENLAEAELVILEENERALPHSPQIDQLREAIAPRN